MNEEEEYYTTIVSSFDTCDTSSCEGDIIYSKSKGGYICGTCGRLFRYSGKLHYD